jgi:hypothetical protein
MIKVPENRVGFVTQEIFKKRFSICMDCQDMSTDYLCKHCGCHMDSKCQISSSECPLKKWEQEKIVVE